MSAKTAYGKLAKERAAEEIRGMLDGHEEFFVTRFTQVKSNAMNELRRILRKNQVELQVVKNSVCRRVLESAGRKPVEPMIDGSCAIAFSKGDVAQASKVLLDFANENQTFKVCGVWFGAQACAEDRVKALAALPSRPELLTKVVGGLKSPMFGLVFVLQDVTRKLVRVLDQIKQKKPQN